MTNLTMPWGKHRGQPIDSLPRGYLRWLAERCEDEEICEAADEELAHRDRHFSHFED